MALANASRQCIGDDVGVWQRRHCSGIGIGGHARAGARAANARGVTAQHRLHQRGRRRLVQHRLKTGPQRVAVRHPQTRQCGVFGGVAQPAQGPLQRGLHQVVSRVAVMRQSAGLAPQPGQTGQPLLAKAVGGEHRGSTAQGADYSGTAGRVIPPPPPPARRLKGTAHRLTIIARCPCLIPRPKRTLAAGTQSLRVFRARPSSALERRPV